MRIVGYWHYNSASMNEYLRFAGYSSEKFPLLVTEVVDKIDPKGQRYIQAHGCEPVSADLFQIEK